MHCEMGECRTGVVGPIGWISRARFIRDFLGSTMWGRGGHEGKNAQMHQNPDLTRAKMSHENQKKTKLGK